MPAPDLIYKADAAALRTARNMLFRGLLVGHGITWHLLLPFPLFALSTGPAELVHQLH
jgi:hypothetical protein